LRTRLPGIEVFPEEELMDLQPIQGLFDRMKAN